MAAALGASLAGFACGNEPNDYVMRGLRPSTYTVSQYLSEVSAGYDVIRDSAPGVALVGPDTSNSGWLKDLLAAKPMGLTTLTQHLYPYTACSSTPLTASQLLSTTTSSA